MTSSVLTVAVLAVLWLVVVVPMVLRRGDARAGEKSVARFGRSMRALTRRGALVAPVTTPAPAPPADGPAEVFVPSRRGTRSAATPVPPVPSAARRPVPAAREALMYPADRSEMSAARAAMMARRRRALTVLVLALVITLGAALVAGGAFAWTLALIVLVVSGGYVAFLRGQSLRDRARRQARLRRAERATSDWDATGDADEGDQPAAVRRPLETVVRIDDDDLELHVMDTVDLTGLYSADAYDDEPVQRRAG